MIDRALDAGVNLIDTADVYAFGQSEEILGAAIRGRATTCSSPPRCGFGSRRRGASGRRRSSRPARPASAVWASTPSTSTSCTGPTAPRRSRRHCAALDDLVARGLVPQTGTSNFRAWEMSAAVAHQRGAGSPRVHRRTALLLAGRARGRARADPAVPGRRRRGDRVEPVDERLPHRSVPGGRPGWAAHHVHVPTGRSRPGGARRRGGGPGGGRPRRVDGASGAGLGARATGRHLRDRRHEQPRRSSTTTSPPPSSSSRPRTLATLDAATALAPIYPRGGIRPWGSPAQRSRRQGAIVTEWSNRDDRQADAKAQYEHIMTTPAPPADRRVHRRRRDRLRVRRDVAARRAHAPRPPLDHARLRRRGRRADRRWRPTPTPRSTAAT